MSYPTPILIRVVYRCGCDPGSHCQRHRHRWGQRWKGHDKLHRHFCRALARSNSLEEAWACFGTPQPYLRIPEEVSNSQLLRRTIKRQSWVERLLDPLRGVLLSLLRFPSQTCMLAPVGVILGELLKTHACPSLLIIWPFFLPKVI